MRRLTSCYISLFCVAFTVSAYAQQSAKGQVLDVEDKGIQGVLIEGKLTCERPFGGPVTFTGSTNTVEDGSYSLDFSGPGTSGSSCFPATISITAVRKPGFDFVSNDGRKYIGVELPQFISVSAADYGSSVASEMIVAGFGDNLATTTEVATSLPLPFKLGGRSVFVKDRNGVEKPAELFFVSSEQINYIIPLGLAEGIAIVKVKDGDRLVRAGHTEIRRVALSIFTLSSDGKGLPSGFVQRCKPDNTCTYEFIANFDPVENKFDAIPIDLGRETDRVFLGLLCTGVRNRGALRDISATIGGTPVEVLYAGPQTTLPGVDQINLFVPRTLIGRGKVAIEFRVAETVKSRAINVVTVEIR